MDRYVTVSQGSVFFITETLASLEGLEKGPAGNTALAAAFRLAQEMDEDQCIVVQETEYTGAGKHINPQLSFARQNGIDIHFGDPKDEIPGKNIILPAHPSLIRVDDVDLDRVRRSISRMPSERTRMSLPMTTFATLLKKPTAAKNLSAAL